MPSLSQATFALQRHFAALRVVVKFALLDRAMRKYGYDPNQPRAPAGVYDGATPIGGRWIDTGVPSNAPARVRVAVSAFDNPGLYYVDLEREDMKGGHGFAKHVARSNTQLIAYQLLWHAENPGDAHPAEGSFNSPGEANNFVSQVLRLNAEMVQRVISGQESNAIFLHRFDFPTGREAFSPDTVSPFVIRPTFWVEVLIRRHQSPPGYVVLTAYPRNDTPNEEFVR